MIGIKNVEMPDSCEECFGFVDCYHCEGYNNQCVIGDFSLGEPDHMRLYKKHPNCPLVEIKE